MTQSSTVERQRLALRRPEILREACFIGGEWQGNPVLEVVNPATGRQLGRVPDSQRGGAEAAVDAATAALPQWRRFTARARGQILRRWFELILENEEDLARLMTAEQGKPLPEARAEIRYAAGFVEWYAEEGKRAYGEVIPANEADRRIVTLLQGIGVAGAVTPWNFPAAMVTRKAAPALAAGCTLVIKPSELTPFSALALARLAEEAGLPAGVLNVITGTPEQIGAALTSDPRVRKFSFTGSTRVGKLLAEQCAGTVKRVSLELGGNAPLLVFDDVDVEAAVEGAIASKFRNTGQTCVCANRLLIQAGIYNDFADALAERVRALVVGDGLSGPTDQGPLINEAAVRKVEAHVSDALTRGGRLLTGGERLAGPGSFFSPTVIAGVAKDALLCREETFGPVAGLVRFETESEAIQLANSSEAGLAAYIFTRDLGRSWRVSEALECGMVGVNTGAISTEVAPFGGVKESGIGREGSRHGLTEYLELKSITMAVPEIP